MSEVKVNKISPRTNCGTVTVGDSGDSVSVTAGVPVTVNGDLKSNALKATDGGSIISQSGTTITLGASGDTIELASGASQSGFGRTGTVDWQTGSIKTSNFTAENGKGFFVNTAGGVVTATLPSSPSAGNIVSIADYGFSAATNKITIGRNSSNISGFAVDAEITVNGAAVTLVYVDGTKGWVAVNDQNSGGIVSQEYVAASGGSVATCGDFKIHTFTGPGTFTVSNAGNAAGSNTVDYLVLAGGGGGGGGESGNGFGGSGGGGGAGGYRYVATTYTAPGSVASGAALPVSAQGYPITVGGGGPGGAGATSNAGTGTRGSNSVFSSITSTGGGGGSGCRSAPYTNTQGPGGSGGGNSGDATGGSGTGNTPPVSPPQGNNGAANQSGRAGGGGGSAAAAGSAKTGANGDSNSITGSPVARAGGGGGGNGDANTATNPGGSGGGGAGSGSNGGSGSGCGGVGGNGSSNTGGGGGGKGAGGTGTGGTGGSGVVIIRYKFQ